MLSNKNYALVRNIKIKCTFDSPDVLDNYAIDAARKALKKFKKIKVDGDNGFVYKKSVDARNKDEIYLVYTVAFEIFDFNSDVKLNGIDVISFDDTEKEFVCNKKAAAPPVVVGFGPSGMFCALALAKSGLNPIVIERGEDVDSRFSSVNRYWNEGLLNPKSNVQFGEGGAGTFSDGKLLTRISDKLCHYVLEQFVKYGAPKEILYLSKPHVGTDNLRGIVKNIRNEIIRLGGKVCFSTTLTHIKTDASQNVTCVELEDGTSINCCSVFLCIGHSARDTMKNLMADDVKVEPKPFSVGVRIEHLQSDIDASLYGKFAGAESLGASQYTLSKKFDGRAVYSFCMCPGGVVVASASDNGQIVTNGMSNYARDGLNANSAIAVSVNEQDYGNSVEGAIAFQENIERKAFMIAGGDGTAPIQLLGDFLDGTLKSEPSRIMPTYTGNVAVRSADDVFPNFITDNLRKGISMFERDISGFTACDAVLTFPETRTSSPVRIPRDSNYVAKGFNNLYPCGEGAGYAGGITSAAVDGLRAAISFLKCLD